MPSLLEIEVDPAGLLLRGVEVDGDQDDVAVVVPVVLRVAEQVGLSTLWKWRRSLRLQRRVGRGGSG